jgi:hypothetical protein
MPALQEYLDFINSGDAVVSQGLQSSVMVGPYQGRFENAAGAATSNNFALYCVDYLHYAGNADGLVNVYGVDGGFGEVSTTRFDDASKYRKAAYLASMFDGVAPAERGEVWSALHAAIWNTTSGVDGLSGSNAVVSAQSAAFFSMVVPESFTGEGWYVLSSTELAAGDYANGNYDGTGQEFLVRGPTRSVPEPGTILLMITGLLLMVGANRRRLAEIC